MIITIANEKGGSGKSTLCINLALQFLAEQKDIVVLDTDPQQSVEVFVNIRSETSLPIFPLFNRTGNITDTLKQMVGKYQIVIIDTKGEHSKESQRAILLSDLVLIPTTPSQLDSAVLLDMLERVQDLQALNEKLKALVLINRIPPIPTLKEKQALVEFIEQNNTNNRVLLLKNHLSERIAFKRSISEGLGVMECGDVKAKREWEQFFNELTSHLPQSMPNKDKSHAL
ncbi:AAA family ATPase [Helicobacter suis]|uniref:PARA protein ParA n=2 Tax=Helicobacter suis TaxID=104628 RepID=A0ABM7L248_9HELI|nr:AAA family ATPase [Helicobacter suis]BCD46758.1 PARA protein ParA [Helicobacter suis]BCD48533.1 PARA protein ParA [Helicobacter suis]BCD50312.1 PARA protein ParA [Helicobacter suis]BCD52052.1 PARA protein ParA [Helicobacter suis]BDR29124.1 chromosome partitioning protein ParA [Helicobacter suis HS1]